MDFLSPKSILRIPSGNLDDFKSFSITLYANNKIMLNSNQITDYINTHKLHTLLLIKLFNVVSFLIHNKYEKYKTL